MKRIILILAAAVALCACRSPVMIYDDETAAWMTEAKYYEAYPEKNPNAATITIIIQ